MDARVRDGDPGNSSYRPPRLSLQGCGGYHFMKNNNDTIVELTCQGVKFDLFRTEDGDLGITLTRVGDPQDEGPSRDLFVNPATLKVMGVEELKKGELTDIIKEALRAHPQ